MIVRISFISQSIANTKFATSITKSKNSCSIFTINPSKSLHLRIVIIQIIIILGFSLVLLLLPFHTSQTKLASPSNFIQSTENVSLSSSMDDGVAVEATSFHDHHHHQSQVLKVLQALKEASHQLQTKSADSSPTPIKALLELEFASNSILSSDPHLTTLSSELSDLKSLIETQQSCKPATGIGSFLTNRLRAHEISRLASSIESKIQAWIDRETINSITLTLDEWSSSNSSSDPPSSMDEESLLAQLNQLRTRLTQGFNIELQDMLLKSRLFQQLESLLCNDHVSKRVRELTAYSLKELVLFNKDVFVGEVLVGQTIESLVSMGTFCSLDVLRSLIKAIKSPLVDELESCGGIMKIVNTLHDSADLGIKIMALDCLMEIGYYGRKEAVEAMLRRGIIKKLVYLQRSELGGDLVETGNVGSHGENEGKGVNVGGVEKRSGRRCSWRKGKKEYLERHPFASCVARFAVQLEVGEGLRQREKRAFKQEILKRISEACVSDAEAATIIAEVLWGSSP